MATLFIADLHLSTNDPEITECFYRFLEEDAIHADALYILGDLFEFWIGDDDPKPLYAKIAQKLHALSQKNIPIYFIHGNRDFMLGEKYAKKAGMFLLPEVAKINLYGVPTLIMHGDQSTPTAFWKYGPTHDNNTDHWYEFSYDRATKALQAGGE